MKQAPLDAQGGDAMICKQCSTRVAVHGNYCRECLDLETKDLSNEELQAMETIYAALGHRMSRDEAERKFAAARARLEQRKDDSG